MTVGLVGGHAQVCAQTYRGLDLPNPAIDDLISYVRNYFVFCFILRINKCLLSIPTDTHFHPYELSTPTICIDGRALGILRWQLDALKLPWSEMMGLFRTGSDPRISSEIDLSGRRKELQIH